jgi:membrane protein
MNNHRNYTRSVDSSKRQPRLLAFLRAIYQAWVSERPGQLAAALAYFGLFSIAPMIYLAFTIANVILNQAGERAQFHYRIKDAFGPDATLILQQAVESLGEQASGGSILITAASTLALLFAASGMFFQIQYALNSIFKVLPAKDHQTQAFILQRLFSFFMVLGFGLLLVFSALVNIFVAWFGSMLGDFTGMQLVLPVLDVLALFGLITLSFALVYRFLPNTAIKWGDVWPGAALSAAFILLAASLLRIYLSTGRIGSAFEAAGAFAIILIVINIFAQIFLFGALFTREYINWFGSKRK